MTDKEYVCADCGHHQSHMNTCDDCGSSRVITVKVAKQLAGEDYMKCFEPKKVDVFPILTLRNGDLLLNADHMSAMLREEGRIRKDQAADVADGIDELVRIVRALYQQAISSRTTFDLLGEMDEVAEINATLSKHRLQIIEG